MRTDGNPIKQNPELSGYNMHRIIMPVYIPSTQGYYNDAFKIFKLCLDSLILTTDREVVSITIIDNGSISEVRDFALNLLESEKIDQLIINRRNRGKADAIVGVAKACYEPFITISDADVLFLNGWLQELEIAYTNNPRAGNICPFPALHLKHYWNSSTWFGNIMKIRRNKVVNSEVLERFAVSLTRNDMYESRDFKCQDHIVKGGKPYLIGAGHFVAMYRRVIFDKLSKHASLMGLKGGLKMIEQQVDKLGYYKISLTENKVLHMGNKFESWMDLSKIEEGTLMLERFREEMQKTYTGLTTYIPYWLIRVFGWILYISHLIFKKMRNKEFIKTGGFFATIFSSNSNKSN